MTFFEDFTLLHFCTYYKQEACTLREVRKCQHRGVTHADYLELVFGRCMEDALLCVRVKLVVHRVLRLCLLFLTYVRTTASIAGAHILDYLTLS